MGKKMDDADVKKECPSCGLGVALDARICEFCGWDFDEEDEWIIQIEKLERDLVLEKQKFEPGTVGHKIESSLHTPAAVMKEQAKASAEKAKLKRQMEEVLGTPEKPSQPATPSRGGSVLREARPEETPKAEPAEEESAPLARGSQDAMTQEARPESASSSVKLRRVRKVKGAPPSTSAAPEAQPSKTRLVKKTRE